MNDKICNIETPLIQGVLTKRYIGNSSIGKVYEQDSSNCFCYVASRAYINTIARIHGSRPTTSFADCCKIANYNYGLESSKSKGCNRTFRRTFEKSFHGLHNKEHVLNKQAEHRKN